LAFAFSPLFFLMGRWGFLQRNGSAGKGAAVCAAFIATLAGADGRNTLVSEEKGAAVLGVLLRGTQWAVLPWKTP
jgi:hypothetical protein